MLMLRNHNRREHLQSASLALSSLYLPEISPAEHEPKAFWLLDGKTGRYWSTTNAAGWCLAHAHEPILRLASTRLTTLSAADGDQIVRQVVRRCGLNCLEIHGSQVRIQYWGIAGLADLRPLFKALRLANPDVVVMLQNSKTGMAQSRTGDEFLFGDRTSRFFAAEAYFQKWANRFEREPDDLLSFAPGTSSGFAWPGVESNRIPWAAMKSAWRRASPFHCRNCERPTILANFGLPWISMFQRSPRFIHVCCACNRSHSEAVQDVHRWIIANLEAEFWPQFEMLWDRRIATSLHRRPAS